MALELRLRVLKPILSPPLLNQIAESLKKGNQCMVFVHSRKDTGKTARQLAEISGREGDGALFDVRDHDRYPLAAKGVSKSRWVGG